ncbi:MAG: hypothetical protein WA632_00215 [Gallionella sp.]
MTKQQSSAIHSLHMLISLLVVLPAFAMAWEMEGTKTLTANTIDNQHITLGAVRFEQRDDRKVSFVITMDRTHFSDYFLSMKEFKCIEGPSELFCYVPYPYPQPGTVTAKDMAWLEHSLLFLYKLPKEFGAKLWNGLYFRLERTEHGLLGTPQAVDLNLISAPPDNTAVPPFTPGLRDDIAPGARWIKSLTIE